MWLNHCATVLFPGTYNAMEDTKTYSLKVQYNNHNEAMSGWQIEKQNTGTCLVDASEALLRNYI